MSGTRQAPTDDRRRVLEGTDIVSLVGEHLTLKAKGREYVGLCPFHDDHKPSMYVVPQKQIFHCFSCGAGGNALDFMMRYHRMEFREALESLAERAGVELTRGRAGGSGDGDGSTFSRREMVGANEFAQEFFRAVYRHAEHGRAARALVESRGISAEMVESFRLGAAPDRWDGLLSTAERRGVRGSLLLACGLAKPRREGSGSYDAFRNRLMFPIHDRIGRVIGFGGRRIDEEDEPKYINSPESALFDKSSTLFGIHQAARAIQGARRAVVVEGYTDVIACHQAGVRNVVATLGTSLTAGHARALRGLCDEIVLLFDGDEAGQRAADRALEAFFAEPVDVKIAVLPGGRDPDDVLREDGVESFERLLAGGRDALAYRFDRLGERLSREGLEAGSAGHTRVVEEELDRLASLGVERLSPVRRESVIARVARLARVSESVVVESLGIRRARVARRGSSAGSEVEGESGPGERGASWAADALGCVLVEPTLTERFAEEARDMFSGGGYGSGPLAELAVAVSGYARRAQALVLQDFLGELEDPECRRRATELSLAVERMTGGDSERVVAYFRSLIGAWRRDRLRVEEAAGSSLDERLESLRRRHGEHGGDPRVLPRPM